MLDIQFTPLAFEQYNNWLVHNKDIYKRLQKLILETARTPFEGTVKPESFKNMILKDTGAGVLTTNTGLFTGLRILILES